MASVDLAAGSTFAGRYRVLGRLAAGGMGAVYEVLHLETRRRRALKVMLPELFARRELRDRFRREAHVTASVKSEHLVDVFDAGVDEASGMPFLVMELLEGEDLGWLVARTGPLAPSDAVSYLAQVASALDRTHAASIVHRDLKPENLFVTQRENGTPCVKILDFGISKIVNEAQTGGPNTTSIGTPAYMAPEQIAGGPVTPAADLHALGLIAYTLLTGRAYWQDDVESTDNALAFALRAAQGIREGAVSRARRHGHELPAEFDVWFSTAVALDPKRRFKTATETVRTLAEALGLPVPSVLPATASRASPARGGSSPPSPRVDSDFVPSTMHGTELGTPHKKPAALVRWLAGGVALGLVAVAASAVVRTGSGARARPTPAIAGDPAAPIPAKPMSAAVVVAPVGGPLATNEPAPVAAPATERRAPRPASGVLTTKIAASSAPVPRTEKPAQPEPSVKSSAASAATASATASFPAASGAPRVKYTRD
jgi:serine/threonine-protein kinase